MSSTCQGTSRACHQSKCNPCINDSQMKQLYSLEVTEANSCLRNRISNYSSIHAAAKSALIDMTFNLGCTRLRAFRNLKAALEARNYRQAEAEMIDSL